MESGTLLLQKPSYSLYQMHFFKNDLFTFRSRKWHNNGTQNDSILSSFSDHLLDPILDPSEPGFWTENETKMVRRLLREISLKSILFRRAPFWRSLGRFSYLFDSPMAPIWLLLVPCSIGHPRQKYILFRRGLFLKVPWSFWLLFL